MREVDSNKPEALSFNIPSFPDSDCDQYYSQFLFDTLRTAVLYLDKWGRIRSANEMARELFGTVYIQGKTVLELLDHWENPVNTYQEILRVARTGHSVMGLNEKVMISGEERWFQTDKIAVENAIHGFNGVVYTLDDISQIKQQELSLARSEANYRAFVENSDDAIWRLDFSSPIKVEQPADSIATAIEKMAFVGDCNHLFNTVYDVNPKERFNGLPLASISFKEHLFNAKNFVTQGFRLHDWQIKFRAATGEDRYLKVSAQGIMSDGMLVGVWGVTRDVSERQRYIERLEYQTSHDMLTGLPNRIRLQTLVNDAIDRCDKDDKIALMIIDLDSFKEINDTLGHDVGDYIIQAIGPRIRQQLAGTMTTIARLGGDEFAILLTDISDTSEVEVIGRKILACIRRYFRIGDIDVELRASLGVSIYPDQADNFSTLMRYADVAMYYAKKEVLGVNIYNAEQDAHSPKRLSLMSELGKAIRNRDLSLHFQPKISLGDQKVVGVEALARWTHPVLGFISPGEFIPIAEMTDLINELTEWVLDESLCQVKQWHDQSLDIKIAVNVSARNLLQDNFCEHIECLLAKYNLPASCLELEITESTIMKNTEKTLAVLEKLNNLGVELSIDDFGTGYSSLAYLKRLPVKWLKIDYSFIINMMQSEQDQIIVNSTINMAHNLGLMVVAEGVESQHIMKRLGSMQCEQAQGFHIAKPMPADDFLVWCDKYRQA